MSLQTRAPMPSQSILFVYFTPFTAYGWIDGIKYWNEVICKSVRLQYVCAHSFSLCAPIAILLDCYRCWCTFLLLGLVRFVSFYFVLFLLSVLFALSFHLLNNPKRATNIENVCRIFVYYSSFCPPFLPFSLRLWFSLPLCEALAATFNHNPSCIVCIANTIENNRKKQFLFIFWKIIVGSRFFRKNANLSIYVYLNIYRWM